MADFRPSASLDNLRQRARLLQLIRDFFRTQGFWEVETPLLSADTVVDRFLEPIAVRPLADGDCLGEPATYWLQTSPEFGMKRLVAAGAEAIFQVARAFRRDELGPLHNPEFTMIEWYRVGDSPQQGRQRLAELCQATLPDHVPCRQLSYHDAFEQALHINPHRATLAELQNCARRHALNFSPSFVEADRDEWLNLLLAEVVEPRLGQDAPTILFDFPATQAALARVGHDQRGDEVAARFELYIQGIELANGYHELLDAEVLAERQREANEQRLRAGRRRLPEANRLLAAMRHGLPDCTGVALGFDRLVLVALGATTLRDVMAFPFDLA